ncbi:hypothetical protein GCM10009630_07490 [Kribbella jejuensis]|uniref:4-amino-4-deoxy-L-arabinose transferase-like glycosyltransferase n=1 Tax=Kribbella jejuensis TaxID=236068 RepID=A0A542EVW8_9ACTN|nr:hypothetical protein [Kribbella jejuensis]TQJ19482.1 hypothetical protein FB475_3652 [Kribbella jejuensis]
MRARARRRGPRTAGPSLSGLVAGLTVALLAIVLLALHSTVFELVRFVLFTVIVVTLPGFALWRLIGGYGRNLVEDLSAGFSIGTAGQVLVYLASASIGLQAWSWVWAPVVLVIAFVDSDARARVWRRVERPLRPLQAWLLAASTAVVLLIVYRRGPGQFLPAYTDPLRAYPDLAFQQALAASAKYDVPIRTLWLGGEPMKYHTFFHQATAATQWGTRIDLTDLIHSLSWLPLFLAGCGLVFALSTRLTPTAESGATWAGPLAVFVAGLGGAVQPFAGAGLGGISTAVAAYLSPTQNLGVLIALALCIVAVDLLRSDGRPRSRWVLLVLLALVASGAKSTILPVVGAGFAFAFLQLGLAKRPTRPAFLGGLVTLVVFVAALITIFGGSTWGTEIKPFQTFVQLAPYPLLVSNPHAQLLSGATTLLSWALAASGLFFLGRKWRDTGAVFLAGVAVAGLLGTLLTSQSGVSQLYFLRTAFPVVAVLASAGLAQLVGRLEDRRAAVLVGSAGVLGLAGFAVARSESAELPGIKGAWLWTLAVVVIVAVLVAAGWKVARRPGNFFVAMLGGAVAACMIGAALVPLQALVSDKASNLVFAHPFRGGATAAEAGAAQWLRRNSKPGELIATNAHCIIQRDGVCDSRHFWLAALSERPVLVEGWSYSNQANRIALANDGNPSLIPYWNREQLAANDAAFKAPSPATIDRLKQAGVRWLYADNRAGEVSPALRNYVRLRHATLDATIYELR